MSLAINVDNVKQVLLADGWHTVQEVSFDLDAYEYKDEGRVIHGGGSSGICATGFYFTEYNGGILLSIAGPLTAILAVRYK